VPVYARPRVSIIPTGSELTPRIRNPPKGKVVETHGLFLAALIEGAGGIPIKQDIVPDDVGALTRGIESALRTSDIALTIAGSSLGEPDLTEDSINAAGKPGVLVHGVKLHRGRVMGLGVVAGKAIVILPGPIQGAANAFAALAYPIIRAHLGREFESPPWLPARVKTGWDAGDRFRDFSKVVYVKARTQDGEIWVEPWSGETEKMTLLTRSQGYLLLGEGTVGLEVGESVRLNLLPGLSSFPLAGG
jgi:molybdenum cofactor synthesis domain-containing protein